jgi:uncharacterized protein YkwD
MKKIRIFILLTLFILTSCVTVSEETATSAPPLFVTSTLPPTKQGLTLPTALPPTATPTPDPLIPTVTPTSAAACRDSAILVEDVTIPDNTSVPRGQKFTKTWKFQNMGRCTWTGYTIRFLSGDRMSSPESAPVPETEARATVDVSVELTAPPNDGAFTGIFELRNAAGDIVPIGTEKSFWVKIIVGNGASPTSGSGGVVSTSQPADISQCKYNENAGYVQQLVALINQARSDANIAPVTVNAQLTAAAQKHSLDMSCNNFLSHTGSNGSWIGDRLSAAGYNTYTYEEIIAIGTPQDAMSQWRNDAPHWESVLNPFMKEIGVGYVYSAASSYGGYFTVDFASP